MLVHVAPVCKLKILHFAREGLLVLTRMNSARIEFLAVVDEGL